jgi:hypothetical protein
MKGPAVVLTGCLSLAPQPPTAHVVAVVPGPSATHGPGMHLQELVRRHYAASGALMAHGTGTAQSHFCAGTPARSGDGLLPDSMARQGAEL